ncbi:GNAT family N-acetyltransferase [Ktedonospora formicarum]|uniref:Alanine acetyltransferase n=1 Tax=Ktedonospora formicarum TaxID=2778364 RepID=A0A8J3HR67_9CHLR|nr:GNAT family protein [Ktedonospora formicarum]GHO42104.1 alanine acetyltransferase [Ktedonospora formicarum]
MLHGKNVYLRPIRQDDLPKLAAWTNDISIITEYNFFHLRQENESERRFLEGSLLSDQFGRLVVVTHKSSYVVGNVSYHQRRYGPNDGSIAYNIGIMLLPEHRGKGYGVEAQRLLVEYLFATYPVMRVEASTDITNIPEQRALEKAGFTRDGVLRKVQWRSGDWHDMVIYSKLRGE